MEEQMENEHGHNSIHMPAPTTWPIALALGVSLIVTGMVTSPYVSLLGLVLTVCAIVGWFRNVQPVEAAEFVEAKDEPVQIPIYHKSIEHLPVGPMHRKIVPVETFLFTTGLKGGIAGGIAMIVPATIFSLIKYHSLWYAMNLMAAGGFVSWAGQSDQFLALFHMQGFLAALAIHTISSLLVGLLYGAITPMFPRRPILLGGLIAPVLWSGLLHSVLEALDPVLNQRIDWPWFVISQVGFGIVAGIVVSRQERVRTWQYLPFAVRAGIETPGAVDEKNGEGQRP